MNRVHIHGHCSQIYSRFRFTSGNFESAVCNPIVEVSVALPVVHFRSPDLWSLDVAMHGSSSSVWRNGLVCWWVITTVGWCLTVSGFCIYFDNDLWPVLLGVLAIEVLLGAQSKAETRMLIIKLVLWVLNVCFELFIGAEMQWLNVKHILHPSCLVEWTCWIDSCVFIFKARVLLLFLFSECSLMIKIYKVR